MNFLTLSRHALVWSTRSLVWMGLVAVLLVGVAVVGGWLVQSTLSLQKSQDTPPGKMVAAEGEWVHLLCVGRPEAPVIFLES